MTQEIVFYHSAQTGAPSSTLNALGAAIAVLDACLVNGFNSNTVSTLTQTGGVATATTSGTNGFSVGEWVEVAGATPSAYNGRVKVTSKPAANQFTYAIAGGTTSPASLSSATAKYPAAGWTKSSGGTNIAAYQAGAGSLGLWMQVEDNNPYADSNVGIRTRQCQGWTGLDSATVLGNQINIQKNTGGWLIVADQKTVYLYMGSITTSAALLCFAFGEVKSFYPGDSFSSFQNRGRTSLSANVYYDNTSTVTFGAMYFPFVQGAYQPGYGYATMDMLRPVSQIGGPVSCEGLYVPGRFASSTAALPASTYQIPGQGLSVPNLADNSVPVSPVFCVENTNSIRGKFRGVYMPLGKLGTGFVNSFQRLDAATIDGVSQSLLLLNTNAFSGMQVAFQVDGAWG